MKRLIIIGASGHGKVCADIARLNGYEYIAFLDDDRSICECAGYVVIGDVNDFENYTSNSSFFIAVGNANIRRRIAERVKNANGDVVTLKHPDSVIAEDVTIGTGSAVMAGTVINSGTVIGEGCIINTSSSVDHDCKIGDFVHVAVGAHVAGTVIIGDETWIGAGVTVSNNLTIHGNCIIGAGAVVINNIDCQGTYVGCPARNFVTEIEKIKQI